MERLDKIVSIGAGASRSDARKLILRGKVQVNGNLVRDIAFKVDPNNDEICLSGEKIFYKKHIYLIMNKPKGVLTATEDKKKQTVIDLIPAELFRKDLFPVGRLDKDTTGMLIITNDGDFAHQLLSPNKKVPKKYLVQLDGEVKPELVEKFRAGLTLADGTVLLSATLEILSDTTTAIVTITEGKYHQIKRMFGLFDLGVNELKRISFAGLNLPESLSEGEVRELTVNELECINNAKKT
ncbi:MAG: rRNA pseudouridine synthase [Clostridia bacterium]|nr:rRNA pseudouridine synthase [Clostridia bacterium]MBQ9919528.1 rRNA pseudouridine synthase [Clostridia bacterium]